MTPASPAPRTSSSLTSNAPEPGIFIGVGHAERQDDGVGPFVAEGLRRRGLPAVAHGGDGTGLLDLWESRSACIVIDAVANTGATGGLSVFTDLDASDFLRTAFVHSTHRLGLPEAVALGRALGRLPGRLIVIGVTGAAFGFGSGLSPPVESAAERLIDHLAEAEDAFGEGVVSRLLRAT